MKIIAYLRVSTKEQGESGLGLAAQSHTIREYAAANHPGVAIANEFREVLSGGRRLAKRPVLLQAIAALDAGDVLVVGDTTRLSRGASADHREIEAAVAARGATIEIAEADREAAFAAEVRSVMEPYVQQRIAQALTEREPRPRVRDQHE